MEVLDLCRAGDILGHPCLVLQATYTLHFSPKPSYSDVLSSSYHVPALGIGMTGMAVPRIAVPAAPLWLTASAGPAL